MRNEAVRATTPAVAPKIEEADAAVPWLQGRDLFVSVLIVMFCLIGWLLPEGRWFGAAQGIARQRLARTAKLGGDELETVKVVVGQGKDKAAWIEEHFRLDWLAHKYLSWIQLLACYRPWPWRPRAKLVGRQYLDEALAQGRGVILLTANFAYKDLMTKVALSQAGYGASHLSRDSHGFAESRLGKMLLNPIYVGIENRFLRERLVFSGSATGDVNKQIRARLQDNRPVLVTVTPLGRRVSLHPFLHGRIRIATGALNFACETEAVVLPVFTIRKPDGAIETIIEHPLLRPSEAARGDMITSMLDDYVPRLETYVAQYPDQFSFPTSDRHGRALIEPWTAPARQRPSPTRRRGEVIPEPS